GGTPTTDVTPFGWAGEPEEAVRMVVACEKEAIDKLRAVIPHTGTEGRSEALEHLMEHLILRKQNQIDFLTRAVREATPN
ncbi:MAG: hypothetical protein JOZ37_09785, partial [Actinobacteria bacterium]|nr:hypothetical protein [Actinomycetota bacterium]